MITRTSRFLQLNFGFEHPLLGTGVVLLLLLIPVKALADKSSYWIPTEVGATDRNTGAIVQEIKSFHDGETQVDVQIPVDDIENYEVVVVTASKRDIQSPKLIENVEWLRDNNQDAYGVRFTINGISDMYFQIKLHMNSLND